jgi:hypothetical protein
MFVIIAGPDRLCVLQMLCAGSAFGIIVPLVAVIFIFYFLWLCSPARAMASSYHEVS